MKQPIRQAVVLAGGSGTRLGELTAITPKPLLSVGGRPFLDWVVGNLARHGIEEVVLTIGYRAVAFDEWLARSGRPIHVRTFVEDAPLGTGGALPLLMPDLDDAFLVLNGDTLLDAPLQALASLRSTTGALGVVALRSVPDVARYGAVRLEGSVVTSFDEKGQSGPGLINAGVYALHRSVLEDIPEGRPVSFEREVLSARLGNRFYALAGDFPFIDIGTPESYSGADDFFRARRSS